MLFCWFAIFFLAFSVLSYQRASLLIYGLSFFILTLFLTFFQQKTVFAIALTWCIFAIMFVPLLIYPLRRKLLTSHILAFYRRIMPSMSRTEKEALAAGSVTWEGDLFKGMPNWNKFYNLPKPLLSDEEQAFIDGPVNELCVMVDDWEITHELVDMPEKVWRFLKTNGFFGLIIPKQYGGKAFSAYAHSQILVKIYSKSTTVASSVAVPNSLGPAELLLHYGTETQKNYYLPRLASGEDVPCFALTGPDAGSDAGAMQDTGIVCHGEFEGKQILGIKLNFNKRYITLAPVATVIGLAFKMYDPQHLLGSTESLGITCALIPRNTPNMEIGRRHFPLNIAFQNGPIHGKDVFIPLDWIIGGPSMIGQGWRMLMECLAAGRAISLPASATGGMKALSYVTGAYSRIRKQFNVSIGKFEGIEEVLARIAGHTYIADAGRSFAAAAIDSGAKPAIASAILKYHATEFGKQCVIDAMDIHGGKGICLGPKNYLARGYQSAPIAITVEGANILTRNMIIFGQGAMRCHPYIYAELEAAQLPDKKASLIAFDQAIIAHVGYTLSNFFRTFILGLTSARLVSAPTNFKRIYQQVTRFSSAFALISDVSLLILGGALKRKESISARLGDLLSDLYLLSASLKHHADAGSPVEDKIMIEWIAKKYFYSLQTTLNDLFNNYPNRWVGKLLKFIIFPWRMNFKKSSDNHNRLIANLIFDNTPTRERLSAGAYIAQDENNALWIVQDAFLKSIASEPVEKVLREAKAKLIIEGNSMLQLAKDGLAKKVISAEQFKLIELAENARSVIVAVDDFDPSDLCRQPKADALHEGV